MAVSKTKYSTKKQIVSYEIPSNFNPFEMGERIIRVEEELKRQRELMLEIFKSTDKRFEAIDKRFEDIQKNMDKRFEAIDKRFEDMQKNMDKRFEAMQQNIDKRFNVMLWIIASGFAGTWSILAILLSKLS